MRQTYHNNNINRSCVPKRSGVLSWRLRLRLLRNIGLRTARGTTSGLNKGLLCATSGLNRGLLGAVLTGREIHSRGSPDVQGGSTCGGAGWHHWSTGRYGVGRRSMRSSSGYIAHELCVARGEKAQRKKKGSQRARCVCVHRERIGWQGIICPSNCSHMRTVVEYEWKMIT